MALVPPLVNPLPRTWCPTVKPVKWCFAFLKEDLLHEEDRDHLQPDRHRPAPQMFENGATEYGATESIVLISKKLRF